MSKCEHCHHSTVLAPMNATVAQLLHVSFCCYQYWLKTSFVSEHGFCRSISMQVRVADFLPHRSAAADGKCQWGEERPCWPTSVYLHGFMLKKHYAYQALQKLSSARLHRDAAVPTRTHVKCKNVTKLDPLGIVDRRRWEPRLRTEATSGKPYCTHEGDAVSDSNH